MFFTVVSHIEPTLYLLQALLYLQCKIISTLNLLCELFMMTLEDASTGMLTSVQKYQTYKTVFSNFLFLHLIMKKAFVTIDRLTHLA